MNTLLRTAHVVVIYNMDCATGLIRDIEDVGVYDTRSDANAVGRTVTAGKPLKGFTVLTTPVYGHPQPATFSTK
jgi:hypothetical protein